MSFKNIVENKKILLLGPAAYLKNKKNYINLDNYDIVVKINKMVEKNVLQSPLNSRNEILYHCLDINVPNGDMPYNTKIWLDKKVQHVRITHPPITEYYLKNIQNFIRIPAQRRPEHSIVDSSLFMWINRGCKTLPNAGTIAIFDLLSNNPSKLTIRGITFCKTPYSEGYKEVFYRKKTKSQHDHDKQLLFFSKFYQNNYERIDIDEELDSILRSYK